MGGLIVPVITRCKDTASNQSRSSTPPSWWISHHVRLESLSQSDGPASTGLTCPNTRLDPFLNSLFPHLPFDGFFTLNKHRLAYLLFNQEDKKKIKNAREKLSHTKHAPSAHPRQHTPRSLAEPSAPQTSPQKPTHPYQKEVHGFNNGK
jgi:hypothetical protein